MLYNTVQVSSESLRSDVGPRIWLGISRKVLYRAAKLHCTCTTHYSTPSSSVPDLTHFTLGNSGARQKSKEATVCTELRKGRNYFPLIQPPLVPSARWFESTDCIHTFFFSFHMGYNGEGKCIGVGAPFFFTVFRKNYEVETLNLKGRSRCHPTGSDQ